jgi:hypothetical protein
MTTPQTATLSEWLSEQIAADETVARDWMHNPSKVQIFGGGTGYERLVDPAHVLAVCAAHRRIVDLSDAIDAEMRNLAGTPAEHIAVARRSACDVALTALATAYADRPGFQEAWR